MLYGAPMPRHERSSILIAAIAAIAAVAGCTTDPLPAPASDGAAAGDLATVVTPPDAVASPDAANGCAGLDEAACKARAGCVADYCQGCGCSYSFAACRAPGEKVAPCPGLGCAQGICCRSNADCATQPPQPFLCFAPGQQVCGGPACPPPPPDACKADGDCASHGISPPWVCEPSPCCSWSYCIAGCTKDADCAEGNTCGADHHCAPTPCNTSADCPPDFECPPTKPSTLHCVRRTCMTDAHCPHFCVDGACYSGSLGTCGVPPA